MTDQEKAIEAKKQIALEYYATVPIFKYAAHAAGVTEDTLLNWRKNDSDFSDKLLQARSQFLQGRLNQTKPEFPLERLFPEFKPKQEDNPNRIVVNIVTKDVSNTQRE